jgi:glycosyltransferase involved in cell wall biosynthesis
MSISLCMIVKNEEIHLARCLQSARGYVDEIIVIDTGSSDKTKEIALSFGALVFDYAWRDDFSHARNFAKEKATKEWILQLDADEYLKVASNPFDAYVDRSNHVAFSLEIENIANLGSSFIHSAVRLFKCCPEITYRYRLHEQPSWLQGDLIYKPLPIRIVHTGYLSETVQFKEKNLRNLSILEKEIQDNPNNGFLYTNLSTEYMIQKNYQQAIKIANTAYEMGEGRAYQAKAIYNIVYSLIQLEQFVAALEIIEMSKAMFPNYTDLVYFEGNIYESLKQWDQAIASYQRCSRMGQPSELFYTQQGVGTYLPAQRIKWIHEKNSPNR